MYYREAGQFKTSYAADSRIFTIRQDRTGMLLLCLVAFVLVPLAEIAPELTIPGHGRVQDAVMRVDACGIAPIG